ncbi:MAG: hypothetical protein KDD38_03835 [Bdellovibrionales bacterium]|nr:hypothetical protein [Bdellovibrionales bacterium]
MTSFSISRTVSPITSIKFFSLILCATLIAVFNFGCESDDDNKLAKAQECLDKVDDTNIPQAQACAAIVAGLTSPESYVIRCSVGFIVGGVTASSMASAFSAADAAPANLQAATLMGALSHDSKVHAAETVAACKASKVASLDYLATLSQTGTIMTIDGSSTTPTTFLTTCSNGGSGGTCDDAAIGTAVTSMYDVYCIGDAATNPACSDIGSAIAAGGGNPAAVAIALYALLQ